MNRRRWVALAIATPFVLLLSTFRTELAPAVLEARWATPPSRFVEALGVRVHVRIEGQGPTLVLLHGTFSSLQTWDGWVEQLAKDFTIVRLDLPGHGLTGPDPTRDYSMARTLAVLDEVAKRLDLKRFHLAGNSLGGHVAWRWAAVHPELVDKLILVDASGFPRRKPPLLIRAARMPIVNQLFLISTPRFLFWRTLREIYGHDDRITDDLVTRYEQLVRREGNRRALLDRLSRGDDWKPGLLAAVQAPTLIMWGAEDAWIPASDGERFDVEIKDSTIAIFPGLGHVPMEEDPIGTAREAREFLLQGR